jgi:uncharacterized protein (DUF362 family)/Pyruvate/2-oxoacid:ferredoxin oxidoreductase delta subunit
VKAGVAIERCPSYSAEDVGAAVRRVLDLSLADRVREIEGKLVLVKPNLLAAREPERGITTHPVVVGALIDYLRGKGADVVVGDSPAGALRGVGRVWEKTGMLHLCKSKDVPLVNFEAAGWITQSVEGRTYQISRAVLAADYIVNLAKFKTHVLTLLTGAIKNMFGCVPGFRKSALHLAHPRPRPMSKALVDIFSLVPPWVSLADAVIAMDLDGPSSGRLRNLGFIAASTDSVALDAVLARVAGIDPLEVPTTAEAFRRGLGEASLSRIVFPCLEPEEVAPVDFKVPGNWKFSLIPGFAGRLLSRFLWVKAAIDPDICTGCGECLDVCAARAIVIEGAKAVIDHRLCTSCLCCHEACPVGAVQVGMSRLARFMA